MPKRKPDFECKPNGDTITRVQTRREYTRPIEALQVLEFDDPLFAEVLNDPFFTEALNDPFFTRPFSEMWEEISEDGEGQHDPEKVN